MDLLTLQETIELKKRLIYCSPCGGRYRVFLTITNLKLIFSGNFDRIFSSSNDQKMIFKDGIQYVVIEREDISSIKIKKSLFERNLVLSLNGRTHTFKKRPTIKRGLFDTIKK